MSANIASPMNFMVSQLRVTSPASIGHHDRNVAEVGSMTDRWFNANFGGDSNDDEGIDAAISKGNVQRCGFKC